MAEHLDKWVEWVKWDRLGSGHWSHSKSSLERTASLVRRKISLAERQAVSSYSNVKGVEIGIL